jgi:hypothetical protein
MKKVEFVMLADRIALKIDGEINRIYKADAAFRADVVADMICNSLEPSAETKSAFPWLTEFFPA